MSPAEDVSASSARFTAGRINRRIKRWSSSTRRSPWHRFAPYLGTVLALSLFGGALYLLRKRELEGIVSKRADAPYTPGNRGLWLKVKCLYREEFLVVGWTDPEGRRPWLGALLLAYYDPDGRLVYAGRAGTGIKQAELERLWRRLQPLSIGTMPLDAPPSRTSRFGSPLVLSRVHWVRPELVAEVKFLTWTDDNLLRQVVYEGLCEDKPAAGVRRPVPHSSR
jgi:bifunctional non-homologous end joining protein LigD